MTSLFIREPETWPEFNKSFYMKAKCLISYKGQQSLDENEPVVLCFIRWYNVVVMLRDGSTVNFNPSYYQLQWSYTTYDFEFCTRDYLGVTPPKKNWLSKLLGL